MRIQISGSSADNKRYERDMRRPLCPHCYNGKIIYKELHNVFICTSCGNKSFLATEDNKEVKVICV